METLYKEIKDLIFSIHKYDDFEDYLKVIMNKYRNIVENYNYLYRSDSEELIKSIQNSQTKISECITCYLAGRYSDAYDKLSELLNIILNESSCKLAITKGSSFYRGRISENNGQSFTKKEIFHVPFNKRSKISTQRYSAPGYPCLYLGNSIYDCWEELGRPTFDVLFVSLFIVKKNFLVIDLRIPELKELNKEKLIHFLKKVPLIISCSLPVQEKKANFKVEYVIPQLIIEYIMITNRQGYEKSLENSYFNYILGVYYTSTHTNNDFNFSISKFYNLALPSVFVDNKLSTNNYCHLLASYFELTIPTCYEYENIKKKFVFEEENIEGNYLSLEEINYKQSKIGEFEHRLSTYPKESLPSLVLSRDKCDFTSKGGACEITIETEGKWEIK